MNARPPIGRAARRALDAAAGLTGAAFTLALSGYRSAAVLSLAIGLAVALTVLRHVLNLQEQGR